MSESPVAQAQVDPVPTVVVDHLDVTYRIYADTQPGIRKVFIGDRGAREHRAVPAVRDVSFMAFPGQAVGIIGHNGSGKSTMLRAIAGLLPIESGRVFASSAPVLLGVSAALNKNISARRNIYLGATALGMPREFVEDRFEEIVEFAGVDEFIDLPLRAFSSGMRSRLQFAIAAATTPDILMIDEALSTGDAEFKERSDTRIREMIDEAGTVFIVSHSLRNITDVCDRALWLDHGVLVADGKPDEVIEAYQEHVKRLKAERKRRRSQKEAENAAQDDESG